jgi:LmbE family N-acetylglucosaminyl deacetylase
MPINPTIVKLEEEVGALFLFAHQDDEFGVFAHIEAQIRSGITVHCAYLTDGQTANAKADERNKESLKVLGRLGVQPANIHFVGQNLGIADMALATNAHVARRWLHQMLSTSRQWSSVFVTAWEGGHPDHDVLHAITVQTAYQHGLLDVVRQYSLYNGAQLPRPWFRVMAPLKDNGPSLTIKLRLDQKFRFLLLCLQYPSQWRTWVGLWPFVLCKYLVWGVEQTQAVTLQRTLERPHTGQLLYERTGRSSFEALQEAIRPAV